MNLDKYTKKDLKELKRLCHLYNFYVYDIPKKGLTFADIFKKPFTGCKK